MKAKDQEAFASHQKVLFYMVEKVTKPVLELGAGNSSTIQLHDILEKKGVKLLTIEQDSEWLGKFIHLNSDLHSLRYFSDTGIESFYKQDSEQWGLVFIDNGTWDARDWAIKKYKDIVDYIVLHDCDFFPNNRYFGKTIRPINGHKQDTGVRSYNDIFKYWIEIFVDGWELNCPPTLLGSNKHKLDDISIDGMIIANRS
jgi:hypothetical protein